MVPLNSRSSFSRQQCRQYTQLHDDGGVQLLWVVAEIRKKKTPSHMIDTLLNFVKLFLEPKDFETMSSTLS